MTEEARQAAAALVSSLREMLAVTGAQKEQARALHHRHENLRMKLAQWSEARHVPQENGEETWTDLYSEQVTREHQLDRIRQSSESGLRYETASLDAFDALMRLCEDPAARDTAREIASNLRELRLLRFEDRPDRPPLPEPPPRPEDPTAEEAWRLEVFQRLSTTMDAWHQARQEALDAQMDRSDALLHQALALAEDLPRRSDG